MNKKGVTKIIVLIVLAVLFLVNLIYLFTPLVSEDGGLSKYGFTAVSAVGYNEEPDEDTLPLTIVWVEEIIDLNVGDFVIIKDNKTGEIAYWVEEVLEIDQTNNKVKLRFNEEDNEGHDQLIGDLFAEYKSDANLLQKMYYVNIQILGYTLNFIVSVGVLVIIYFSKAFKKASAS